MRRFCILFGVLLTLLGAHRLSAQNGRGVSYDSHFLYESVDPEADSEAIRQMRARLARIRRYRPTVALVLSGGGAKGAAHVGVFRYLEEHGIPVDMIAGTSMGGLMGGLYALGYDAAYIDSLLRAQDWDVIMSDDVSRNHMSYTSRRHSDRYALTVPFDYGRQLWKADESRALAFPEGLLYGYNVEKMLSSLTVGYQDSLDFINLPIPFFCVSSDLASIKEYNWTRGSLVDAMRSTMSIPFMFRPVRVKGMVLTDGGTRNNFPVDIARAMGADYVIGVNLHVDTESESVRGLGSFVSQLIDMTGVDTYKENVNAVDVLLEPNLAGFNMMSFDTESIAQLIENGYRCADDHAGELAEIKKAVGASAGRGLGNRPATDIAKVPVRIREIELEGITRADADYFRDRLHLRPGRVYGKAEIENEMAYIYASGAFSEVSYRLLGTEEPYRLVFRCHKAPAHSVSVGARFDSDELAGVLLNVGLNANRLSGHKLSLTTKLANNPYVNLVYSYTPAKGYVIGLSARTAYSAVNMRTFTDDGLTKPRIQFWHNSFRFYGSNSGWLKGTSSIGLEYESLPFLTIAGSAPAGAVHTGERFALSAFYDLVYDTRDDRYFPSRGTRVAGHARYLFAGYNADQLDPYLNVGVTMATVLPVFPFLALIPSAQMNISTGSELFPLHRNYLGGAIASRYFENQAPFAGYNGVFGADSKLVTADLTLRFRLSQKDYIGAVAAGYLTSQSIDTLPSGKGALGLALQYSHATSAGPIKLNVHWASDTRVVGLYVSAGFDF